ncbi:MAG: Uncharacterised protein [Polaribacter sp. SA4-10]|nr:MAG: Uncharacterised protein [Polaribacter sp. SA4-10]
MKIENSTIEDFEEILKLYEQARMLQTRLKMVIWPAFSKELILQEIAEKRQFKGVIDNKIACVWAIAFSDSLIWEEKNKDAAIYIHRIATNKKYRGNNFVKTIVDWAVKHPLKNNYKYIRLDTVGDNTGLIRHYVKCGFQFLGLYKLKETKGLPDHYKNATVSLFEIEVS